MSANVCHILRQSCLLISDVRKKKDDSGAFADACRSLDTLTEERVSEARTKRLRLVVSNTPLQSLSHF